MKRFALMLGALVALSASPASAFTETQCAIGIGFAVCQPRTLNPDARIIQLVEPVVNEDVTDADRRTWNYRCRPRKVFDGLTTRWQYAAPGCSLGPLPGESR